MISEYIDMLIIEAKMTLKTRFRYKVRVISDVLILSVTFLLVLSSGNDTSFQNIYHVSSDKSQFLVMIGFLFWQFGSLALGFSTSMISSDASTGMLELKVQGKFSIIFLSFYKMIVGFISDLFIVIVLTILYSFFYPIGLNEIFYILLTFIFSIPSILGMYGIGLLISTLAIKEKNVSSFVLIIQSLLIFVTNIIVPLGNNLLLLVPYTGGIEIMRKLFIFHHVNIDLVIIYVLVNLAWLIFGICIFKRGLQQERTYGSFDTY